MENKVRYISDIEIILGTYEEFVLGYKISKTEEKNYNLSNSFANHSHQASIRCCASSGQFLASGGADETIHLYNMLTRKEHGSLVHQNGTITCLEFHGQTHMFSASEDGSLCVWRVGSWQCEKILKGHRGPITSMSIHPTGKLALTVGRDRTLRTWNLVKGRSAYVTNLASLKSEKCGIDIGAEEVRWSPDGLLYSVMYRTKVDVYDVNIAGIVYSLDLGGSRIACICFISNNALAVGGEGGVLEFHDVRESKLILKWNPYSEEERVRCIACIGIQDENKYLLVTSSSTGLIKLWRLNQDKLGDEPKCVGDANASCRITCLTLCTPNLGTKRKRKKNTQKSNEIIKVEDNEKTGEVNDEADDIIPKTKMETKSISNECDDLSECEVIPISKHKEESSSEIQKPKKKKRKSKESD